MFSWIFRCSSSRVGASSGGTVGSVVCAMNPPSGLGSMRYVKCVIRLLSSMLRDCSAILRGDPDYVGTPSRTQEPIIG
jgi:hypothetical protein